MGIIEHNQLTLLQLDGKATPTFHGHFLTAAIAKDKIPRRFDNTEQAAAPRLRVSIICQLHPGSFFKSVNLHQKTFIHQAS